MTWARFDDNFCNHPKVLTAGDAAIGLFVRMVCYSNRYLTDGAIPGKVALSLCPNRYQRIRKISALLEAGLLIQYGDDYTIHDFHDYNPKAADILAKRKKEADRKRKSRVSRPANVRADVIDPDPDPDPVPIEIDKGGRSKSLTMAEIEKLGFPRYGQLGGAASAAIKRLGAIYRHEIDAALMTPGTAWAYAAKVIVSYREELAKGPGPRGSATPPAPKKPPPGSEWESGRKREAEQRQNERGRAPDEQPFGSSGKARQEASAAVARVIEGLEARKEENA